VTVLWDQRHACGPHRAGAPRRHLLPVDLHAAGVEWQQAGEHVGQLDLAVALDARHPDDLAGVQLEVDPVEHPPTVGAGDDRTVDLHHAVA
jgi:hypothetical protein